MTTLELLTCFLSLAGSVVGLKIMRRAWRIQTLSAWCIGIAMLSHSMVTQPIAVLLANGSAPSVLSHALGISVPVSLVASYVFVWRVFRSGVLWAAGLAWFGILSAVVCGAVFLIVDRSEPAYGIATLLVRTSFICATLWACTEALLYRRRLIKRSKISLSNPLVENQLLVWALTLLTGAVVSIGAAVLQAIGEPFLSAVVGLGLGVFGTVGWYLGFVPPQAYSDWILSRADSRRARGATA